MRNTRNEHDPLESDEFVDSRGQTMNSSLLIQSPSPCDSCDERRPGENDDHPPTHYWVNEDKANRVRACGLHLKVNDPIRDVSANHSR